MFSEIIFLTLRIMFVRYDFILLNLYIISTRNDIDLSIGHGETTVYPHS